MPADEIADRLKISLSAERGYETVAGLERLGISWKLILPDSVECSALRAFLEFVIHTKQASDRGARLPM